MLLSTNIDVHIRANKVPEPNYQMVEYSAGDIISKKVKTDDYHVINHIETKDNYFHSAKESLVFSVIEPVNSKWSKKDQKRFCELAVLISDNKNTAEESSEFLALQQKRRYVHPSQSAKEIIIQAKKDELLEYLTTALKKYAIFHDKYGKNCKV